MKSNTDEMNLKDVLEEARRVVVDIAHVDEEIEIGGEPGRNSGIPGLYPNVIQLLLLAIQRGGHRQLPGDVIDAEGSIMTGRIGTEDVGDGGVEADVVIDGRDASDQLSDGGVLQDADGAVLLGVDEQRRMVVEIADADVHLLADRVGRSASVLRLDQQRVVAMVTHQGFGGQQPHAPVVHLHQSEQPCIVQRH